jgi:hypothetical protein
MSFRRYFLSASAAALVLLHAGLGTRVAADERPAKLQIFGHLTQAYGESDLGSIQGTSESGSTDLRKIAIQFRWQKSDHETVVVQLSHERFGDDIFSPQDDEVEIDWAFYERRLGPDSMLKVGRLNVPLGIYNEIRDVGTLLPFFNLPISFYSGVLSSAETVDGISVARSFAPRSDWALESEFYLGGWDTFQQQVDLESRFGIVNLEARAEDGTGIQLWLNTPAHGLRLGVGALTWLLDGALSPTGKRDRWKTFHLSIDATGEKWMFRAERRRWEFDQDFGAFLALPISIPGVAQRDGYYIQLGRWISQKIGLFGQVEETVLKDDLGFLPGLEDFHKSLALSLNYRFRPDLLAKIEIHNADTRFPLGAPEVPVGVGEDPVEVTWMIVGLSVSF